jgi:hypothetical protein
MPTASAAFVCAWLGPHVAAEQLIVYAAPQPQKPPAAPRLSLSDRRQSLADTNIVDDLLYPLAQRSIL